MAAVIAPPFLLTLTMPEGGTRVPVEAPPLGVELGVVDGEVVRGVTAPAMRVDLSTQAGTVASQKVLSRLAPRQVPA